VVAEIFGLHAPTNNTKIGTASVGATLPTSFLPTLSFDRYDWRRADTDARAGTLGVPSHGHASFA
jgi:hypothetical protein